MIEREREREAETLEEGEAGSMPGARRGTRSWDSRTAPWAKGRRQTAEPPRDPRQEKNFKIRPDFSNISGSNSQETKWNH